MEKRLTNGFTLIELLTGVAIAGILLGLAVPSFAQAVKESRISAQYNGLVGSLFLARSEAVKGPGDVTVCPREAPGSNDCGGISDWENGWLVFMDRKLVPGETTATVDPTDTLIAVEPAVKGNNLILAIGSPTNSASDASPVAFIRYTRNGGTSLTSASVIVCDTDRGPIYSRAINIILTGDIRRGRRSSDTEAPRDVFNQSINKYCSTSA